MKLRITLFLTACLTLNTFSLLSQITQYDLSDTINIVTTRINQPYTHTGRSITVIPSEVIQSFPVLSLDELLRTVTGVEVQQRGPFGAQADILIRGSTFTQVLVLIDGMRLNDPLTSHFNGNIPIPVTEIDHIEILRGPAAALYGPDAVGGVINIVTKTFLLTNAARPIHAQAEVLHGEYGLWNTSAGLQVHHNNFHMGIGGKFVESRGPLLPSGLRNDINWKQGSLSMGYKVNDTWDVAIRSAIDYRLFNAQYFYTRSSADQSRERVRQYWNQLQVRRTSGKHQTVFNFSHKITQDSFLFNPLFPANIHRTSYTNSQLIHSINFSEQVSLSGGLQFDLRDIESSDRGNHTDIHTGIFLIGYFQPISEIGITTSLRGDWDENYGTEITPQVHIAYSIDQLVLRGSLGKSIRAADFTERFISTELPGPISEGRNLGNPDLEAERAWSYEVGADWSPIPQLQLVSTLFLRESNNLIDYVITESERIPNNEKLVPGGTYFYTQNLKSVNTKGWEIESRLRFSMLTTGKIEINAGYTYIFSEAPTGTLTKYIANHARHLLTFQSIISRGNISLGIQGLWKYRNPDQAPLINEALTKDYQVWNARLKVGIYPKRIHGILQINNIFNERYQDILGANMPGRWAMAGIHWNLD